MKADRALGAKAPTADGSLSGLHVALLFEKPSLRTRSTFEVAIRELGADTLHLPAHFAEGVREPLEDVARNLERWVRALVIRTYGQEKAQRLATAGKRLHGRERADRRGASVPGAGRRDDDARALGRDRGPHRGLRGRRQQRGDVADAGGADDGRARADGLAGRLHAVRRRSCPGGRGAPGSGARVERLHRPARSRDAAPTPSTPTCGPRWARSTRPIERRQVFAPYQVNAALMAAAAPAGASSCTACRRIAARRSPPR